MTLGPGKKAPPHHIDAPWMPHGTHEVLFVLPQDKQQQQEAEKDLLAAISEWVDHMDPEGPFFCGKKFTMVDIMLIPWLLRQAKVSLDSAI